MLRMRLLDVVIVVVVVVVVVVCSSSPRWRTSGCLTDSRPEEAGWAPST